MGSESTGRRSAASRMLTSLLFLATLTEYGAASSWNFDQNRLDLVNGDRDHHRQDDVNHYRLSSATQHIPTRIAAHTNTHLQHHPRPTVISGAPAPYMRHRSQSPEPGDKRDVYRPSKNPADFYKDRVFVNATEREREQGRQIRFLKENWPEEMAHLSDNSLQQDDGGPNRFNRPNLRSGGTPRLHADRQRDQRKDVDYFSDSLPVVAECALCPAERTLVAARGRDRALLPEPEPRACPHRTAPRNARFRTLYGPPPGTLLPSGSHVTVGSLSTGHSEQLCQYKVNVIVRRCAPMRAPRGVVAICPRGSVWGAACHFRCEGNQRAPRGATRAVCGDNLVWSSTPPICEYRAESSCDTKEIWHHGRLTCETFDGAAIQSGRLPHGSVCKQKRCRGKQHIEGGSPTLALTCHSGSWHSEGTPCPPKKRTRNIYPRRQPLRRDHQQRISY